METALLLGRHLSDGMTRLDRQGDPQWLLTTKSSITTATVIIASKSDPFIQVLLDRPRVQNEVDSTLVSRLSQLSLSHSSDRSTPTIRTETGVAP